MTRLRPWHVWGVVLLGCDGSPPTTTGSGDTAVEPPSCEHACAVVGEQGCDGSRIVSCVEDDQGCRVLEVVQTCQAPEWCLDADAPPVCDGDFFVRFVLPGDTKVAYETLARAFVDPSTAPADDHPEAEWAAADGSEWFLLQLPRAVTAGETYTLEDEGTLATLFWSTTIYTPHRKEAVLEVTVDTWQGLGGVATGSVSATMHSPLGSPIVMSDGSWRAPIASWTR